MSDDLPKYSSWEEVAMELAPSRNYWLTTINQNNSPHPSPVWGVVLGEHFYFFTSRFTLKSRNLARDSRGSVHLESAEKVVIIHGRAVDIGEPNHSAEVANALTKKYRDPADVDYLPINNESYNVLYRFEPQRALLWSLADFETSQRRWSRLRAEGG